MAHNDDFDTQIQPEELQDDFPIDEETDFDALWNGFDDFENEDGEFWD